MTDFAERDGTRASSNAELATLQREADRAERRIRFNRALSVQATGLAAASLVACAILAARKLGGLSERGARIALGVTAALWLAAGAAVYFRRVPHGTGALALDRFFNLKDRVMNALSFSALPAALRTGFTDAAIDDGLAMAGGVSAAKAVPLQKPRDGVAALVLLAFAVIVGLFEVRSREIIAQQKTIDAVDVTADDLDAMREFLREVEQKDQSEDAKDALRQFNQLIEDLANKRLDRTEAFRKMQALEEKLLSGKEADKKALEEALKKIGEELKKSELTKPLGEALENKKLVDAEKQLKELAKKLREQGKNIDKGQLEKMREALKRASQDQKARESALALKRAELEKQLLKDKQKQADGGAGEQEKSLLQKRERELERLDREQRESASAGRQLERLDRELAQAAEDLMKDLGLSAQDLEQGAEDVNRMAKEEMSDEEKEQLRQKLEELRQTLRQQGQGGQGQMSRLKKFQKRARGGKGGQSGQGKQGEGGDQGQGNQGDGNGQEGDEDGDEQGQNGQGQGNKGQGQGESWVIGPGGKKVLVLSKGQGAGGESGGPSGKGGQQAGTGHDDHVQGAASASQGGTQDTQVAGQDTGQGGSRSEVIRGAAEKGFASKGYKKVYRDYHPVMEEALNKDEIPGGYRFYVRRYFQLIRPRDDQ